MHPTAAQALAASGLARGAARALLAQVLGRPPEALVAHPEQAIDAQALTHFSALAARHRAGEPLAYLLGAQAFYGRDFVVTPAVLIPRPETEGLVEVALTLCHPLAAPRLLDLGTGSGCIAVTLALERPDAQLVAVDCSAAALAVARRNAQRLGVADGRIRWCEGDWFDAIAADERFDLIVANPPYVAAADPHLDALSHEPRVALTSGADGLADLAKIIGGAARFLCDSGCIAVEHGYDQGSAVRRLLSAHGFERIETRRDAAGIERIGIGWRARG